MKILLSYTLIFLFIINSSAFKVNGTEEEEMNNKSQIIISKYADNYCSAKDDNFFKGLNNEKTLRYSYFRYIGLQNKEISSKDMSKTLINKIREKCLLSEEEESEINNLFLEE